MGFQAGLPWCAEDLRAVANDPRIRGLHKSEIQSVCGIHSKRTMNTLSIKPFLPDSPFRTRLQGAALAAFWVVAAGFVQAGPIRFLPVSAELAGRKIGIRDGKGIIELKDLDPRKRSKAYDYQAGEQPLELVALDRQRPNGKPVGTPFTPGAGMKSPLVVILPDEAAAAGVRAVVVEDSIEGFAWGTLRFLNATGKSYALRCEDQSKTLPEAAEVLDVALAGATRNIGVQLLSEAGGGEVLYSAVWEHDPKLRKLILILPPADPESKNPVLEIIPQDQRAKE